MRLIVKLLLCTVALQACLLSPHDGKKVANTTAPITFEGMHLQPGGRVTIEAWDHGARRFERVASATAESSGYRFSDGTVYGWNATTTLLPEYWSPGGRGLGAMARVRATTVGTDGGTWALMSVNEDWASCFADAGSTIGGFSRNCRLTNSPDAVVTTVDYCPPAEDGPYTSRVGVFYDAPRRRVGALLRVVSSAAPIVSPSASMRLYRADAPTVTVGGSWVDCRVENPRGNDYTYTCYSNAFSVADACAFNELTNGAARNQLRVEGAFEQFHPCHRGVVRLDGSSGGPLTCVVPPPPPPPPPPETRPDLVVDIGAHDGINAPVRICNRGRGAFVAGSELMLSVQGSSQPTATLVNVATLVPRLEIDACTSTGDAFVGIVSGTGGGWYTPSSSATICVDTTNRVDEIANENNCTTRLRTP